MAFRPFGDHFDYRTSLSPEEVRAAIARRRKPIFDHRRGPRGWMLAGVVCLWMEPVNRFGPMLLGRMRRTSEGSRIVGWAGSDLNGTICVLLASAALLPWLATEWTEGGRDFWTAMAIAIAGLTLILWLAHCNRHEAAPLLRFVRRAIEPHGAGLPLPDDLILTVDGEERSDARTIDDLEAALGELGQWSTLVLARGAEIYIQTQFRGTGFIVEKRLSSAQEHFEAVRHDLDDKCPSLSFAEHFHSFVNLRPGRLPCQRCLGDASRWKRPSIVTCLKISCRIPGGIAKHMNARIDLQSRGTF